MMHGQKNIKLWKNVLGQTGHALWRMRFACWRTKGYGQTLIILVCNTFCF
jgi:hypothetical protein